jgi:hypothetical protein
MFSRTGPFSGNIFLRSLLHDVVVIIYFDDVGCLATGYGLDDQGGGSSSPGRVKYFHFSISSRPARGSSQPPIKWVPEALSRG